MYACVWHNTRALCHIHTVYSLSPRYTPVGRSFFAPPDRCGLGSTRAFGRLSGRRCSSLMVSPSVMSEKRGEGRHLKEVAYSVV